MTTSGITSENEWVTANNNEWERVVILINFLFCRMREDITTKHPKVNSLNFEEDLEEELLRVQTSSTLRTTSTTVRSRNWDSFFVCDPYSFKNLWRQYDTDDTSIT